jgi:conjugal transfer ATP-binding protein TraC
MALFGMFGKKTAIEKEGDQMRVLPVLPSQIYQAATLEFQDIIAPSALKVQPKSISLGEQLTRTFFVISYPRYLNDNWFSPIINLDKVFDVSIFIHPVETTKILRTFQKKVAEVQSQIATCENQKDLFVIRCSIPHIETLNHFRDSLQQAQEKMFDVGLYITIYADNEARTL